VITTDTAGRIVLLNRIAEALTGWSQEEAAGRPLSEIVRVVDERTREPRRAPTEEALERRERSLLPEQSLLTGRDGRERSIAGSASPILDVDGRAIG